MSEACPIPRAASLFDTPGNQVADMQRDTISKTAGLDLAGCNVCTIVTALDEFDLKRMDNLGHRFETWPDGVQAIMRRELDGFSMRNKGARIEAITHAIGGEPKCFVLCLHWRLKA